MTLVDVMMVVIILLILSAVTVPNYIKVLDKAKVMPQLSVLLGAINKLHSATGQWPHGEDPFENIITLAGWKSGASGLLIDDAANPYPFWNGPYCEGGDELFLDPWGNPIVYDGGPIVEPGPGESSIASGGPDGVITSHNRVDRRPQGDDIIIFIT